MQRTRQRGVIGVWLLIVVTVLVGACAPAAPGSTPAAGQPGAPAGSAPAPAPAAPKTLVVGQGFEIGGLNRVGRNDAEIGYVINAGLVTRDATKWEVIPWMTESLPSLDNGTWVVNPSGGMVTTWKMRPNIKYHDGTPFHTRDFELGWQMFNDSKFEADSRGFANLIDRIETPDDRTLVVHWKSRLYLGNALFFTYLMPMPTHILGDLYRSGDYEALNNHVYWTTGIVHLGPYKVTEFVRSSHVDLQAFDDYFLGRPKVDRIIWKIITDSNTLLANVLSNEVDVTTRAALTLETALIAEAQWSARGEGTLLYAPTSWTWVNPGAYNAIFGWDAPNQNLVRQAMYHAINRVEIAETIGMGKEPLLDFPLSPGRPQFRTVDAAVKKYPFDARRAEQLFNQAGWRKGADGVLINDRGERFSVDFRAVNRADMTGIQASIAAYLKDAGVETQITNMTDRQASSPEFRNRWPGLNIASHNIQAEDWRDRYHAANLPTEANNWIGNNVAGWRNPAKDRIIDQFFDELRAPQQAQIMTEYLKLFAEELPHLPIKYNAEVTSFRSNIKGVGSRSESGGENTRTWNVHMWEKN